MLFIQSNTLSHRLDEDARLRLLDALAARGHTPLARAARRRLFQLLTAGFDATNFTNPAAELERLSALRPAPGGAAGAPGDLFCTKDCVFFVVFGAGAVNNLSAGVVYSVATAEPLARLERFCGEVLDALLYVVGGGKGRANGAGAGAAEDQTGGEERGKAGGEAAADNSGRLVSRWQPRARGGAHGLSRFVATQPTDFAVASRCRFGGRGLARASELLGDGAVRDFLRRVQELRREGYSPRRLFAEVGGLVPLDEMIGAGLLEREVRVSCRKSGHALFDLPSPDSLAAITISKAKCSLCAAPIVDEVVEETLNPTALAVSLLANGGWLADRIHRIVRSLGMPESEIATGPASPYGESYLAANVCGNSFLFATRDGELTPAFARRAAETVAETETEHLIVVTTGAAQEEGRLRLYEFAWGRARDGQDLGVTIIEGTAQARAEIERAFETALRRELSRQLCTLDAALGLGASDFVLDWFKLAGVADDARPAPAALVPRRAPLSERAAS